MSNKPPQRPSKPGTPKPFLGDDDLSELDAWVETFDALHTGPDPSAALAAAALASQPIAPASSAPAPEPVAPESPAEERSPESLAEEPPTVEAAAAPADDVGPTLSPDPEANPPYREVAESHSHGEFEDPAEFADSEFADPDTELADRDAVAQALAAEAAAAAVASEAAGDAAADVALDADALAASGRAPSVTMIDTYQPDPDETDFSGVSGVREPDLGPAGAGPAAAAPPSRRTPVPSPSDDRFDGPLPVAPRFLHTGQGGHTGPAGYAGVLGGRRALDDDMADEDAFGRDDDDDAVFTSASRPGAAAPEDAASRALDDDLAPPPAPEPRRGPAIVRRAPRLPSPVLPEPAAIDHDAMFSEETRVADFDEIERQAFVARQAASATDEDDYVDIEVSDDKSAPDAPAHEVYSTGRRTAHVLRRGDSTTRTPAAPFAAIPPVALDFDDDQPARAARPQSEDDFSDVAAAVGAGDDDALALPDLPPRRYLTPAPGTRAAQPNVPNLDDALGGIHPDEPQPFADPNEFDEPHPFETPQPFDTPQSFDSAQPFADPNEFDDPEDLDEPHPFDDPNEFDEPNDFDDPNEFDGPHRFLPRALPPLEHAIPILGAGSGGGTVHGFPVASAPDPHGALRPPALTELYSRIKTPTSVPPIGAKPVAPLPPLGKPPTIPPPLGKPPTIPPPLGKSPTIPPPLGKLPTTSPPLIAQVPATPADLGSAPALPAQPPRSVRLATPVPADPNAPADLEPTLDLDSVARGWPEQVAPLPTATLDEASAQALLVYEREIATVDDSASSAALRIEAGRLCERLTDFERARGHYDAALMSDPRATPALRGLRRLARTAGDLGEAIRHLDAEISVAGALERRPLGHYRVDLMMASNEQDLARVAAGELLDQAPSDVRALLAQLELAFLDGRADEFGIALEQLAQAVSDHELRAALQSARGALAAHHNDTGAAAGWFSAAAESDPTALAALLGAIRQATGANQAEAAAHALVELARQVEASDPITAAAAAVRAQQWSDGETAAAASAVGNAAMPSDPLVARLAADQFDSVADPIGAANAFIHWAHNAGSNAERAYAAARSAELDPSRGTELWASAIALDPGDDYAAAQLRTSHVAADATQAAIDVDLAIAADPARERARLRAAYGMIAQGQLDEAIDVLQQGRAARPGSVALSEALGEALAAAGKWTERARLFAELAEEPGEHLDQEVAQLRSALAWEEAVGAAASAEEDDAKARVVAETTTAALDAWERVIERASSPSAHAAAIVLASRLGDATLLGDSLVRAQGAERLPLAQASLALRRARLVAADDPLRHDAILREMPATFDDPRRTLALVLGAARRNELDDAAAALEARASLLDGKGSDAEVAALRLRAAQLALDAGEAAKATALLHQVEPALPQLGVIADLLAAARRRAGDRPAARPHRRTEPQITGVTGVSGASGVTGVTGASGVTTADAFARIVREADLAATQGDPNAALGLYQRALELRPNDPLAAVPLVRVATQLGEPAPIAALALAQLRLAEDAGDGVAKAAAYELLAHIDRDLRSDPGSAQMALESAAQADPSRIDLLLQLERAYAASDQLSELLRLRAIELDAVPAELIRDRVALLVDLAGITMRDGRPEHEIADLYRRVLAIDPRVRLALLHLEAIVRRSGFSPELAELEEHVAEYFEGDAKTQAAFWTRAGETLAEIGRIDDAVQRFGKADAAFSGHVPALEGWRQAALKGQLWVDVAEAASRQAAGAEGSARAALYHFAGVALMDKALAGEQATAAFRRALEADPRHRDAFLRLRILLEEEAKHDELATLLALRLEVEPDATGRPTRIELHRALAELHRNFLSDRETAKRHYREILEADPNDLRAHAAIADIAWEQGNWQEAADALMARARLERAPEVLKTLCFRLGLIYADRLVDVPMALKAFQRALTYQPDDENTLVRLADLAVQVGEWKLALGACERLVKNESDPDRRATHLHRVAKIFKNGFGDAKRAERALNLALDGAPTNDEALAQLVQFYRDANDLTSVRVHLNRVAGAMRARVVADPQDGVAYRVISRAMSARAAASVPGSLPIARAAAELADLLGASGEPEQRLLQLSRQPDVAYLTRPEADEVLYPRGVPVELRHIFQLLGDRIAKHVGVDLRPYGVTRGDRLRARDNPVAAVAQSVASGLGFGDIDVYISNRQPWLMVGEPTSPVSLVIGSAITGAGGDMIRFAAGGALKLAQSSLAIPARLPIDDLGVLVVGMLRLFQPDFPIVDIDADAVAAQTQKLRRLIPTSLMNELKPFALAIDSQRFRHADLSRDLRIAALRAGLVASGSLLAGLRILSSQIGGELPGFLADPIAQGLISFGLGEDHALIAR